MDVKRAVLKGVVVACVDACIAGGLWFAACAPTQTPSLGPGVDASRDASLVDDVVDGGAGEPSPPPPCQGEDAGYPSCPSPPTSWTTQVKPLVDLYCAPCHFDGGTGTGKGGDYSTPKGLQIYLTTALTDLHTCIMPPDDAEALLPLDRRDTILQWLECYAPDN
jgi:hypothetical protein